MGSFEEEELVRMVHDFIESESTPPLPIFTTSSNSNCLPLSHKITKYFPLQEILRSSSGTETERKVVESVLTHMRSKKEIAKKINSHGLKKWLVMCLKIDGFDASLCQTSWITSLRCPAGEYEYVEIMVKDGDENAMRLIVDIDFKSQFELARPTPAYKELADTLPCIFVGNEEKLNKIIYLLCSAAKQSLRERGLHIPPWRTSTYMQCKWLSNSHKKSSGTAEPDNYNFGRENREAIMKGKGDGFGKWSPPQGNVKPKRRDLGGSALSSQFSNMGINCC